MNLKSILSALGGIIPQDRPQAWDERIPTQADVNGGDGGQALDQVLNTRRKRPVRPITAPVAPPVTAPGGYTPSPTNDVSRVPLPAPSLLPPQPPAGSPPINPANLPAPNTPNFEPTAGLPSAGALPPPATDDLSNVGKRISFGQQGLTGTDRLAQITQALQESDPESEVKVTPSGVQVGPPPMKGATPTKGRGRASWETALSALSHADPAMLDNHPLYMLGQGIGGAIGGAVSPRTGAKVQRYNQILDAQTDEMRGLKVAGEEAKVGGLQAEARYRQLEPAIENAKLELERQRNQGVIDQHEYDRQKDVLDRASREKTNANTAAATIEAAKIRANASGGKGGLTAYQQQEIDDKNAKREADRQAASDEYDQLVREETEAGQKKNAAYDALETFRKQHPSGTRDTDQIIEQMTRAAEDADKTYKSFADKKHDALTKVRQNQRPAAATGAATPTLQGAIDAFKASNKRDPNDKELANIKKHYGFQ